jgi:ribosomal protein L6P/L9E
MKLILLKLNLPINFNFLLIEKFNKIILIIFNEKFKFVLFFKKKNNLKINKNLNSIEYKNYFLKNNFFILNNSIYNFLEKLNTYYFLKIKFKGKGYKIGFYKKKKIINFYFGKSHKSIFIYNNIKIKKLNKYKFILLKNNFNLLKQISYKIIKIKKINEYTNRGLRLSRQTIIKRKGKKGSFV